MGFIKGLAALKEEQEKRGFSDRPKARYADIKPKGKAKKVVFAQEIDEGSPNYSEKNGLALFALVHSNPDNWKKSAKCTADEGDCYGCSRGWRTKTVLYVNVIVLDDEPEPYVAIWNRGLGKGSVAQNLIDIASDEDYNFSVTDKTFKFSRTGTTKDDTTYTLTNLGKEHGLDLESFELYDLEQYVFTVSPERQEAYYLDGAVEAPEKETSPVSDSSVDADW